MDATSYLVWFVVMAVLANAVIYGGIALAYFTYLRRADRPRVVEPDSARAATLLALRSDK